MRQRTISTGHGRAFRRSTTRSGSLPADTLAAVLELSRKAYAEIVGLALDEYPLEACGLIVGPPAPQGGPGDRARHFHPCANIAESARVYTVDPHDHLRAETDADERGWEINGVVHSHTHSEPYPSPTDVDAAPDPTWHYVIVSLKRGAPELRSYRIVDGEITSEPLVVI
jgi:proteasome lid subunit RPN8/RPN11